MPTTLVSYDLMRQGQDYQAVIEAIQRCGTVNWLHPLQSVWLVVGPYSANEVLTHVLDAADGNDKILAIDVTGKPMSWSGSMGDTITQWLKSGITNT